MSEIIPLFCGAYYAVRSIFYFSKIRTIKNFNFSLHYAMKFGINSDSNWSYGLKSFLLKSKILRIMFAAKRRSYTRIMLFLHVKASSL